MLIEGAISTLNLQHVVDELLIELGVDLVFELFLHERI